MIFHANFQQIVLATLAHMSQSLLVVTFSFVKRRQGIFCFLRAFAVDFC